MTGVYEITIPTEAGPNAEVNPSQNVCTEIFALIDNNQALCTAYAYFKGHCRMGRRWDGGPVWGAFPLSAILAAYDRTCARLIISAA